VRCTSVCCTAERSIAWRFAVPCHAMPCRAACTGSLHGCQAQQGTQAGNGWAVGGEAGVLQQGAATGVFSRCVTQGLVWGHTYGLAVLHQVFHALPPALPCLLPAGHFQWLSFLAFAASVVFEGIRVVMTEKLLGQVGVWVGKGGQAGSQPERGWVGGWVAGWARVGRSAEWAGALSGWMGVGLAPW